MARQLCVRVFLEGSLHSEEHLTIEALDQLEELLPTMAEKHAAMMAERPGMVEFEFLDEPDPLQRFLRLGTDPTRMVAPIGIVLAKGVN